MVEPSVEGETIYFPERICILEDVLLQNENFKKDVSIKYFKDIFNDLKQWSDDKSKGINKVAIMTVIFFLNFKYSQLPGIIGDRFFEILDMNKDEYIDMREFIHGLFRIYYSTLETKIKLAFDIYDFDKDDQIRREDV